MIHIKRHKKLIAFTIVFIAVAFIPSFVSSPYYLDLLIIAMLNAVLGMTFIIMLRTGLISLGIAAFWGIGAYSSTMLVMKLNLSFWLSMPLAMVITGTIAFVLGLFLIRNAGFSFAILTALVGMLFVVVVGNMEFFSGYKGIANIAPPDPIVIPFFPSIEFTSKPAFFYLMLALFIIIVLIIYAFNGAWIGRAWTSIGLKPQLAESIGIKIFRYRLMAFVLASAICGLMGSFFAHYQGYLIPNTYGLFTTIYIHVYAILGGTGFPVVGPVVGSLVMKFFPEWVRPVREFGNIFTGSLLVVMVIFMRQGILGLAADLPNKWNLLLEWWVRERKRVPV